MAIRVVLDTSVLRRDPTFSSGPLEALSRFAETGYVDVYIPDVVAEEFKLLPSSKIEALGGLRETLRKLRKNSPEGLHGTIAAFEESIVASFEQIETSAQESLEEWIKRIKATVTAVGGDHGKRVMAKYFKGVLPFGGVKALQDFPDAFIAENIADLAADNEVLAVVGDGRLALALQGISGVSVFRGIKELLESDGFDNLRGDVESDNVLEIVKVFDLDQHLFESEITDAVETDFSGRFVSFRNPSWDEKEGEEELYVESAEVSTWRVDRDSFEYLGEGVISIGFTARVEVSVERSTGNPYLDDLYGSSRDLIIECDGSISFIVDREDLTDPNITWSGVHLTNVARIEVEEINIESVEEPEYPSD